MKRLLFLSAVGIFVLPMALAFGSSVVDVPEPVAIPSGPFVVPPGIGHITYSPVAMRDVGKVDPRVTAMLAASPWDLHVGVLVTGHAFFVHGTDKMSNHVVGRAVDVTEVGGVPVSSSNEAARAFVQWLMSYQPRPDEVGSPFSEFAPLPGWFTDSDHRTHLHVAWD